MRQGSGPVGGGHVWCNASTEPPQVASSPPRIEIAKLAIRSEAEFRHGQIEIIWACFTQEPDCLTQEIPRVSSKGNRPDLLFSAVPQWRHASPPRSFSSPPASGPLGLLGWRKSRRRAAI